MHLLRKFWRISLFNSVNYCTEPIVKRVLKDKSRVSEIRQHFRDKNVEQFIPDRFFRIKRTPTDYNFVAVEEIAISITEILKKYLCTSTPVIEANPGLGLLTKELLKTKIQKLFVYDSMINQMTPLRELTIENADRVTCIPVDVFQVARIVARDKIDHGDRFETMFKDIPTRDWDDEPAVKLIGVIFTLSYISYLLRAIAFRDPYAKIGRIEHFLLVSENIFQKQISEKSTGRLRNSLLFNCFMDMERLGQFPRCAFLPWEKNSKDAIVHLIRVVPKRNLFEKFGSNEELKIFWYFVNGICRSKSTKVIAFFENWVPTSGLRLIQHGLNPITEIQDLTPNEVIQLFQIFISLPQFDEENFIHMMEAEMLTLTESAPALVK